MKHIFGWLALFLAVAIALGCTGCGAGGQPTQSTQYYHTTEWGYRYGYCFTPSTKDSDYGYCYGSYTKSHPFEIYKRVDTAPRIK